MRRVLCIDGGGIKGVFPAAFLAAVEESEHRLVRDYFDLIVGTSTGGIIAIGLGLGFTARQILEFYETYGASIFPRRRFSFLRQLFGPKYDSEPLRIALSETFGDLRLGDSKTRLVIPASNLETGDVLLRKTAHHERFTVDFKLKAADVALSTAAAPLYFEEHIANGLATVDGGVWANNPTAVGVVEAISVLKWPSDYIRVLSLGCTTSPLDAMKGGRGSKGMLHYATRVTDLFLSTQSSAAMGTARLLVGHENVQRYSTVVDRRRFQLDDCSGIPALKGLGQEAARNALPAVRDVFLAERADPFVPYHGIDGSE